jgi:Protein of unknown function (DUF2442)
MNQFHKVEAVEFDGGTLILRADGEVYRVETAAVSERLAQASPAARRSFRISPSGYGIHWPELDEDLSVDGLIRFAKGEKYPEHQPTVAELRDKPAA